MSKTSFEQLRDLAQQDDALQLALAGAANTSELQAIASQRGIALSEGDAQLWLTAVAASATNLTPEELDAISEGLSLTDDELDSIAGGQIGVGEAL